VALEEIRVSLRQRGGASGFLSVPDRRKHTMIRVNCSQDRNQSQSILPQAHAEPCVFGEEVRFGISRMRQLAEGTRLIGIGRKSFVRQDVKAQAGNRWWMDAGMISSTLSLQGLIAASAPTSRSVQARRGEGGQ